MTRRGAWVSGLGTSDRAIPPPVVMARCMLGVTGPGETGSRVRESVAGRIAWYFGMTTRGGEYGGGPGEYGSASCRLEMVLPPSPPPIIGPRIGSGGSMVRPAPLAIACNGLAGGGGGRAFVVVGAVKPATGGLAAFGIAVCSMCGGIVGTGSGTV